jgi:hypothetical protein
VSILGENIGYDGPVLSADSSSILLPVIDRLHHADLYAEPLYSEDHDHGADPSGLGLDSKELDRVFEVLTVAGRRGRGCRGGRGRRAAVVL